MNMVNILDMNGRMLINMKSNFKEKEPIRVGSVDASSIVIYEGRLFMVTDELIIIKGVTKVLCVILATGETFCIPKDEYVLEVPAEIRVYPEKDKLYGEE